MFKEYSIAPQQYFLFLWEHLLHLEHSYLFFENFFYLAIWETIFILLLLFTLFVF